MNPGEYLLNENAGPVLANAGRSTLRLIVKNTGDRPVQIGSHYHFFEANRALLFDRPAAFGLRLNHPAGTAVRFEPGEEKEIELVAFGGKRSIYGINNLTNGSVLNKETKQRALQNLRAKNFKNKYA